MKEEPFRYHESRREGNGSITAPVARKGHKCAVEDCPDMAVSMRVTNYGYHVLYCASHARLADTVFGS